MIFWKDFIIDDFMGPLLNVDGLKSSEMSLEVRVVDGCDSVIKEDEYASRKHIQETRRENEPARMVGQTGLDKKRSLCMDAGDVAFNTIRRVEEA